MPILLNFHLQNLDNPELRISHSQPIFIINEFGRPKCFGKVLKLV